jgi:hypothetical protein
LRTVANSFLHSGLPLKMYDWAYVRLGVNWTMTGLGLRELG